VAEQRQKKELLAQLQREQQAPTRPDMNVLDDIPSATSTSRGSPDEQQRRIYDAFHLELRYNALRNEATIRVTVTSGIAPALAATVGQPFYPQRPKQAGNRNRRPDSRPTSLGCFGCAAGGTQNLPNCG